MSVSGALHTPSDWVARFAPLVPAGRTVLDVACGNGRHSRLFAERGNRVVAVDIDLRGVADLASEPRIDLVQADLEGADWPFTGRRFGTIVVTNYLHRPLLPTLLSAIEPGGLVIYETFAIGNQRFGKPSNPAYLLRPGELLAWAQPGLQVIAYEHGEIASPKAAVMQRLAAARDAGDAPDLDGYPGPWPLPRA